MDLVFIAAVSAPVLLILAVFLYNNLVRKKNDVENALGSIDAVLKQRYDLIPNLISSVKQYMKHESDLLSKITAMRTRAMGEPLSENDMQALDAEMSRSLAKLMVSVENYPELKASDNFLQLQGSLNEVEERLSAARRNFNRVVTAYNDAVEMFPSNFVASVMRLKRKSVFQISEAERAAPDVKALFAE